MKRVAFHVIDLGGKASQKPASPGKPPASLAQFRTLRAKRKPAVSDWLERT